MTPDQQAQLTPYIMERGRRELDTVTRELGPAAWAACRAALALSPDDSDSAGVLAFGATITEFMNGPFHHLDVDAARISGLGARLNLIVALFDRMVDKTPAKAAFLPAWKLRVLLSPIGRRFLLALPINQRPDASALTTLMATYLDGLEQLARRQRRGRSRVTQVTKTLIQGMYRAEMATLPGHSHDRIEATLMRKSALPFMVMGAPGALLAEGAGVLEVDARLRWLEQVGEFWGLIDDAADLEGDRAHNQPNALWQRLEMAATTAPAMGSLANAIAAQGVTVFESWRVRTDARDDQALLACLFKYWIAAWLEPT